MTTRYAHAGDDDSPTQPRKLHRTGSHTCVPSILWRHQGGKRTACRGVSGRAWGVRCVHLQARRSYRQPDAWGGVPTCRALAASGERSYTTATFVAARELGLRRARGSSHVESNRRLQAAYLCAQPPLLQEHPLPTQRVRGYDKVFASAWLDCDTLVVGTKDNKVYNAGSRHQDTP
jgi:hypothetical protein